MKNKIIINFIVIIFLIILNGCIELNQPKNSNTIFVDINGKYDYNTIQDAVNNSLENDTIFVYEGIYYENIIINKNLNLIGENKNNTVIDGKNIGDVIFISEFNRANISGFTIKNSGNKSAPNMDSGIDIRSNYNIIKNNIILDNEYGIFQFSNMYNNISNNQILNNKEYGIYLLSNSNYNQINNNIFSLNSCCIRIKGSKYNDLKKNIFHNNQKGIYLCCGALKNTIYNNVFINNTLWHAQDAVGNNYWNSEEYGNYWDDYDFSSEESYAIKYKGQDYHPIKNLTNLVWYDNFLNEN
jgi:parallel beta-helix repeat protein